MAKTTLQLRRGTQSENSTFTGALGEVVVDTTRKTLVVHDGATPGGSALATIASPTFTGTPSAPTATGSDNSTKLATTAFVKTAIAGFAAQPTSTDQLSEGASNFYFTKDRLLSSLTAAGNITITQPGGAGTNVRISYSQPTNVSAFNNDAGYLTTANITGSLSVIDTSGQLQYDPGTGVFTFTQTVASVNGLTGTVVLNSDNISDTGRTNKWASSTVVRGYLAAGTGITYTGASGTIALSNTSIQLGGKTISLTSGTNQTYTTDDLTEGSTNKYATSSTVRGYFTQGTGVTITNGSVAIGQAIGTTDSPSFANATLATNLTVNTSLLKTDAGNSRVGINKATPAYTLDVGGDVNFSGKLRASGDAGTSGYVLLSGGTTASPTWSNISNSLPEIIELDRIRTVRQAQSTWYGFINGTTFTDPEDSLGTVGTGIFTPGMLLQPSVFIMNGIASSGSNSYSASILGTTMTVSSQPVLGTATASTSYASGGAPSTNTIVMTSPATAVIAYASGGANGTNTVTLASLVGVFVGQSVSGTGVQTGTTVTTLNGLTITLSQVLLAQASGSYTFQFSGVAGIQAGQTIIGTGIPAGTTVTAVNAGTLTVTLSQTLTAQAAGFYTYYTLPGRILAGMGVNSQSFVAGNTIVPGTYITKQLTSSTSPITQLTYSSGGATSATSATFTAVNDVAVGQIVSGTGIPDGTFVTRISGLSVTFSNAFTVQASGTYNFYQSGTVGTYQISTSQTIATMSMVSGLVTISLDPVSNTDLDNQTAPYQVGQQITVSGVQPLSYNGFYAVTACTPTTVSFASTTSGLMNTAGYIWATINSPCAIVNTNTALLSTCTINGTSLTIGSITSGTVSVGQALFASGITNLYIVSGSGLSWTLNRNAGNLGNFASMTATSYTVSSSQNIQATLINGSSKTIDGGNTVFTPTTNSTVVPVTNPIQLQIQKNGIQLDPWLNNSGSVWQNLTSFGDYTVDSSGNIVFATPPQAGELFTGTVLVGRSVNPVVRTYPFRPLDIMIGT